MKDFRSNMIAAERFRHLSRLGTLNYFLTGYMRGLRRNHHGDKFGTKEEHELWLSLVHHDDTCRKMLGLGYRAGLENQDIQQALSALNEKDK